MTTPVPATVPAGMTGHCSLCGTEYPCYAKVTEHFMVADRPCPRCGDNLLKDHSQLGVHSEEQKRRNNK